MAFTPEQKQVLEQIKLSWEDDGQECHNFTPEALRNLSEEEIKLLIQVGLISQS